MRKCWILCGAIAASLCAAAGAQTVPSISVGNDILLPNWPTAQPISFNVAGSQQVNGLALNAEIADGGVANGGTAGPSFASVDLLTNTIFAGNNTGQQDSTSFPSQIYSGSLLTNSGTVPASGLLASMNISTAGIGPGIYSLKLARFINGGVNGDTALGIDNNFQTVYPTVTNGNLVVLYPGDTNKDGVVNLADLLTLTRNFGKAGTWATGDTNGDGVVNLADFQNLSKNFGKSVNLSPSAPALAAAALSPQVAVPEPASLGLLVPAAILLCRRSRRQD